MPVGSNGKGKGKGKGGHHRKMSSLSAGSGQSEKGEGGKAIRGTMSQFKKNVLKFWSASLLVPLAPGEIVGLCAKPKNARQVLGLDIYEVCGRCRLRVSLVCIFD